MDPRILLTLDPGWKKFGSGIKNPRSATENSDSIFLDCLLIQQYPIIYNNKCLKDNTTYKVENDSLDWTAFSIQVELLDVEAWNVSPRSRRK
jgi:hypothetical protein